MERKWHLEHRDGREWTDEELSKIIRIERNHDDMWPYEGVRLFEIAVDSNLNIYLLDQCMAWHRMDDIRDGEDVRLVFG